jgi:hypothetical protein
MAFVAFTGFPLVYALALGVGGSLVGAVLHAKTAERSSVATLVEQDEPDNAATLSSSSSSTALLANKLDILYSLKPVTTVVTASSSSSLSSTSTHYAGPQATRTLPETLHVSNVVPLQSVTVDNHQSASFGPK